MDLENAAILLQKLFGVALLILCPIVLIAVIIGGFRAIGTADALNIREWIFGLTFASGGIFLGIYICRKEFGWFIRKR
jgi:hypothetical protein